VAAEVDVYEGRITSSPGPIFANILAISKACVQEGVKRICPPPTNFDNIFEDLVVNGPSPC
jgi:hypothetical protein